jgi:hypothetical protein
LEAVVAQSRYYLGISLERLRIYEKNLCQNSRWPGHDSNPELLD